MQHITLITTGGTIEKTYNEASGLLVNERSIVSRMLRRLRLEDTTVQTLELMSKDSLDMTDDDRRRILEVVRSMGGSPDRPCETDGLVILHGTDTLAKTGELLHVEIPNPRVPIILAGAMRPYEMKHSDALQNLTEALFAASTLVPAVYCVGHGRALTFPGVVKDTNTMTFIKQPAS